MVSILGILAVPPAFSVAGAIGTAYVSFSVESKAERVQQLMNKSAYTEAIAFSVDTWVTAVKGMR